jgi:LysR family nod box-dependent transcriptional activator
MNPGELDLNLLWALDALLRERSVTRAANRIGLGQPAMSAALKRLRLLFYDELLVRQGTRSYLTPLAEGLRSPVDQILQSVADVVAFRPSFDPLTTERTFAICAGDYTGIVTLNALIQKLAIQAPRITVDLVRFDSTLLDRLHEGLVDLVVLPSGMINGMCSEVAVRDRWVAAVSWDNTEVVERLTPDQYRRIPQASYRSPDIAWLSQQVSKWSEPRRVQVWATNFTSLPLFIRGTGMLAIVPERLGRLMPTVRLVDLPFESPPITLRMYWHPKFSTDPGHTWLRQQVGEGGNEL